TDYTNQTRNLFNQYEFGALASFNISPRLQVYGGVNWMTSRVSHLFRDEIQRTLDGKEFIFELGVPVGLRFRL
ncbi:MAG: hypothetical protein AAF193_04335, partial [Bacteroidota bacterium]